MKQAHTIALLSMLTLFTLATPLRAEADQSCSGNASRGPGTPLAAGIYTAKLTIGGRDYMKPVTVLEDVWLNERR